MRSKGLPRGRPFSVSFMAFKGPSPTRRLVALVAMLVVAMPAAAQAPGPVAKPDDQVRFDILEFVVSGNTVLPTLAIEKAVYPFLGPGRTLADAEGARRALEKAYQVAGYLSVTVDIPPQRVGDKGELRFNVVEAPVERVRVTGARYHLPSAVTAAVPSLAPGNVPNFNDMQEELANVARETPHREVTPVVTAGDTPGTMNVELKVQDSVPLGGFVELNNKQSPNTVAGRLEASVAYDNLFQRQHSLSGYWFYSPREPQQANIISLTYRAPLGGPGDSLFAIYNHSNSNTPTSLGGATIARGTLVSLRWRDSLRGLPNLQHALTWGANYRDLNDRNDEVAGFSTQLPALRYPSFIVQYELTRADPAVGRVTTFETGLTFGVAAWSRRNVDCNGLPLDQFECRRSGAAPGFQVFNLSVAHREPLGKEWLLYARLQAQLSLDPLIPAEQSTLGGVDTVRGYLEGEQSGDSSVAGRIELSTPRLVSLGRAGLKALLFGDRAMLRRHAALPGELSTVQMGGVGIGLRVDSEFGFQARFDWARPLFDTRRLDSTGLQPATTAGDARWEVGVRQSF